MGFFEIAVKGMSMKKHVWPAVRTTGIMLIVGMLPAIYTQIAVDAHEKDQRLQTISNQIVDLKLSVLPHIATLDQQSIDFDHRISELEVYKPVYKK